LRGSAQNKSLKAVPAGELPFFDRCGSLPPVSQPAAEMKSFSAIVYSLPEKQPAQKGALEMSAASREFLAMALAFSYLIFVPQGKLWKGLTLLITGLIMGVCAGIAPAVLWNNLKIIVTVPSTLKTIAVIVQIGILSALLKHYGILSGLSRGFGRIFTSAKAVIMILPAAVGMVSVPGGAAISSPFVDEMGERLHLPLNCRASINLTFRHIAFFMLPTSSSMIIMADMAPRLNLYRLILLNFLFIFFMEFTSYCLYLRSAPSASSDTQRDFRRGLTEIIRYLSPIYTIVLLNAVFHVEMYLGVFLSLMLIFLCWGRHDAGTYWRVFLSGLKIKTFFLMVGIYYLQNTVRSLPAVMLAFQGLFANSSGFSVLLAVAGAALFFGLTSGLSYVSLGVLMPLLLGLHLPENLEMIYCTFVYTWSFIGYFFSPLHLCLVLTVQQMGCAMKDLYRGYIPLMAEMAVSPFLIFYLYRFLLM
jgi:hypothetical protein